MRGLLVRVGIDQTSAYGGWNAPVNTQSRRYVYVPIKDSSYNDSGYIDGGERVYGREVTAALAAFGSECDDTDNVCFQLPGHLHDEPMHLDPDFLSLTYGDDSKRGRKLKEFEEDDFIAFYASLQPICGGHLVYALIGLFVLSAPPIDVADVPISQRTFNAHTRWNTLKHGDFVVIGKPEQSGLFERCLPIGEFRDRAYRVRQDLLTEWGGLGVTNGWIQRSANLPEFTYPQRFKDWLVNQNIRLDRAQYQVAPRKA
jgi:Nucleotide modification associated domain 3